MSKVFEGQLSAVGLRFAIVVSRFNSFINPRYCYTAWRFNFYFIKFFHEKFPVLSIHNGCHRSTKNSYVIFFKYS